MSENKLYKEFDICPICGDPLKKEKGTKNVKCSCCGFVAPTVEVNSLDEARLNSASDALRSYKFDTAEENYSLILEDNRDSSSEIHVAALWGKLLATFGVVYIKDMNGTMIPTFSEYDPDYKSILDSEEYKSILKSKAMENVKNSYISKAKSLDDVYKRIDKELNSKDEYDVFICTKISRKTPRHPDYDGYTEDSRIADDFYYGLTDGGLKVFYSDKCCQGIEYDSQILSALLKSKKILIISSDKEYLESPWVQSEWRRWLNFIECGKKEKDSILLFLPHFEKEPFDMPRALKKVQRYTRQLQVVKLLTEESSKALKAKAEAEERLRQEQIKKEAEAKAKEAEAERIRKEKEKKKKQAEKAKKAKLDEKVAKKASKDALKASKKQKSKAKSKQRKADFENYIYDHWKGWLMFIGTLILVVCCTIALVYTFSNLKTYTNEALKNLKIFFFFGLGSFIVGLILCLAGIIGWYEDVCDSEGDKVSFIGNGILSGIAGIAGIVVMVPLFAYMNIQNYYTDETGGIVYAEVADGYEIFDVVDGASEIIIEGRIGNLNVTSMKSDIFQENKNITSLTFRGGNLTIKKESFLNCYNIEKVTFDAYNYTILRNAFKGCTGLKEFNVGKATITTDIDNPNEYTYRPESDIFGGETQATVIVDGGKIKYIVDSVKKYIIGNGSEIHTWVYEKNEGKNVYVDNNTVVFTDGVNFDETVFYVYIQKGLSLTKYVSYPVGYTIYIPSSVTNIPNNFFGDETHLGNITINYAGTSEEWNNITVSDNGNSNLNNAKINYKTSYQD